MFKKLLRIMTVAALYAGGLAYAQDKPEVDTLKTSAGELEMTFLGHGTLMFKFNGQVIHIDPYSRVADYSTLPDADLILITHDHGDHLDAAALGKVRTAETKVIVATNCMDKVEGATVMKNGDKQTYEGIGIEAVPAYNLVNTRDGGQPFHPKGGGNGYVLTLGDTRVYVAGDTENTPEMKALKDIKVAFLPMNRPYTMTPEMVADAAKAFKPAILYPYHYGNTDTAKLTELLKDESDIEVRIRKMP
jgi:L-ascorbate metabolism protein UlaG (beta-lactamase superfamily)